MAEDKYWIWLSEALGAGSPRIDDVINKFADIEEFYNCGAPLVSEIPKLTRDDMRRIKTASLSAAQLVLEKTLKLGYKVISYDNEAYPSRLKNIYAPPAVLYVNGTLPDIDKEVVITMVGTRSATQYGMNAGAAIAAGLSRCGVIVASGAALGIDGVCHRAAFASGGKTIAFLGSGLDVSYPYEHKELQKQIAENCAVVTEFPLGSRALGIHFPIRNRLLSGISLGVVLVEAPLASGAMLTVTYGIEQGKDIFAVPTSIFSDEGKANLKLLRDGAIPVSCALDVINEYIGQYPHKIKINRASAPPYTAEKEALSHSKVSEKPRPGSKAQAAAPTAPPAPKRPDMSELGHTEMLVYDTIAAADEPMHLNDIVSATSEKTSDVLAAITMLEILECIEIHAGARYSLRHG